MNSSVDPTRLYTVLTRTGLQQKDPVLYQLLYNLIGTLAKLTTDVSADANGGGGGSSENITNILNIINQANGEETGNVEYIMLPGSSGGGSVGPAGPTGPAGPPGQPIIVDDFQGDSWIPGPPGLPGVAGAAGSAGIAGAPGLNGENGEDGWPPVLQLINAPSPIAAVRAYRSSAQTFTEDTLAAVSFTNVDFDSDSYWSGGADTRFTVPAGKAGKYVVVGQISWVIFGGTGDVATSIYVNGTIKARSLVNVTGVTASTQVSAIIDLAAGDYVELKAIVNEGGTSHNTVGGSAETWMGMTLAASVVGSGSGSSGTNGALVFIDEKVASNSASLDFTSDITATYDIYVFEFINVLPATDGATLAARVSSNNGSSYDSGSNYRYIYNFIGSNASTGLSNSNSATSMLIAGALENTAAGGGANGFFRAYTPLSGVTKFFITENTFQSTDGNYYNITGSMVYNSANVVNAIQFFMSSGNITSGTIRIYGINKSPSSSSAGANASGIILSGLAANRPSPSAEGRIYLPTDGFQLERDSGSVWNNWGPKFYFTTPSDSGFAWLNQGSSTLTTSKDALELVGAASGSFNLTGRVKTAPSTPYTITVFILGGPVLKNWLSFGILLRQSGAGTGQNRIHYLHYSSITLSTTSPGAGVRISKLNSATSYNSDYLAMAAVDFCWFRLTDNGTNIISSISKDGQNWTVIHTISRTDFLLQGPDQVGFAVLTENAATPNMPCNATILSWLQT